MRQRIAYSLLQAWYCIIEDGLILLHMQFFRARDKPPRARG